MKKRIVCAAMALALCALWVGNTSAKVKTKKLTFGSDFWVGETLVKSGTYDVSYDDKSGEVSINEKKSMIAKTSARAEKREHVRSSWDVALVKKGDGMALVAIAFPDDSRTLVFGDAAGGSNGTAVSTVP
jgi:hypothetical protein